MDMGSLLLVLAVAILVGLYVAQPLYRSARNDRRLHSSLEEHDLSALMAERDRIIQALQELDFDYVLNKIPAEEYPRQRVELLQRGAEILRRLDALQGRFTAGMTGGDSAEARLEAAVAARRADAAVATPAPAVQGDDEIEALIAARRKAHKEKSAGFCPRCGKPVLASDRFCASCGAPIA